MKFNSSHKVAWAITVPKQFGGAQVKYRTLAEVIKTIASVDPSLAQLPQNLGFY